MKEKKFALVCGALGACLAVALGAAVGVWREYREVRNVLEESYHQRLYETQEHLQAIGLKLAKASVAAEEKTLAELFSGVSRQAESALSGLSALPLSHAAMSDTMKFCNQLSEYADSLLMELTESGTLSQEHAQRLPMLRGQCRQLLTQLQMAQETMVQESLRLAASGSVFYEEASQEERPLERVAEPDKGMEYPSMIYDGAFSDARRSGKPKALGEETVTAAQAVELAKAYVGEERVRLAEEGPESGGALPGWGVVLTLQDETRLNCVVTKQGGQLLWMTPEHASFEQLLSVEECVGRGKTFLALRGYGEMEANHYQVYDGLAVVNFVAVQDGALLYPDLVKVQLRMDTGEVVGMEANNYLMNHVRRENLQPTLEAEQIRQRLGERLEPGGERLCVIPYRDGERLCYEVSGTEGDQNFRVYLDANTGEELEILLMLQTPEGLLSA